MILIFALEQKRERNENKHPIPFDCDSFFGIIRNDFRTMLPRRR